MSRSLPGPNQTHTYTRSCRALSTSIYSHGSRSSRFRRLLLSTHHHSVKTKKKTALSKIPPPPPRPHHPLCIIAPATVGLNGLSACLSVCPSHRHEETHSNTKTGAYSQHLKRPPLPVVVVRSHTKSKQHIHKESRAHPLSHIPRFNTVYICAGQLQHHFPFLQKHKPPLHLLYTFREPLLQLLLFSSST